MAFKSLKSIILIALLFCAITSCNKSTSARIEEFVDSYNRSAKKLSDPVIIQTFAKSIPDKNGDQHTVDIILVSRLYKADPKLTIYKAMLPRMFSDLVYLDELGRGLIRDDVKFNMVLCAADQSVLTTIVVDKNSAKNLLKSKGKLDLHQSDTFDRAPGSALNQVLAALNDGLPAVVDEKSKIKMTRVDVNEQNVLVYHMEVPTNIAGLFKNSSAGALLKNEVLRKSNLKMVFQSLKESEITVVKYIYSDSSGKTLTQFTIMDNEL